LAVWEAVAVAKTSRDESWQVLDKRLLVDRSPYARIYERDIKMPDGQVINNFVEVDLPPYVIIFATLEDGRVPWVRQYRIGLSGPTLELPAGTINGSEDPLDAAKRELREETGCEGGVWQFLGKYIMDPNRQCGWGYVYMVNGARQTVAPDANDLGDMDAVLLTLDETRQLLTSGTLLTGSTVMAAGLALVASGSTMPREMDRKQANR